MPEQFSLDIIEDELLQLERGLLGILLFDRTSRKHIIWGTDDYAEYGAEYTAGHEIAEDLITGRNGRIIQPRVLKAQTQKKDRTRARAEVFTPSWVCNEQNNLVDAQWFQGKDVFNRVKDQSWETIHEPVPFPEKGLRSWKRYVDAKRMEITCGEAPYLVSRYDTVTGKIIPISDRIGLLDRKLRVVGENTEAEDDWKFWARRAVESVYGYEFQGDNLLMARENVLFTYIEYYRDRFGTEPEEKALKDIALVISWNLWQMDGFNYAIPYCKVCNEPEQMTLFDFMDDDESFNYMRLQDTKGQQLCKIRDWRSKATIVFRNLVGGSQK